MSCCASPSPHSRWEEVFEQQAELTVGDYEVHMHGGVCGGSGRMSAPGSFKESAASSPGKKRLSGSAGGRRDLDAPLLGGSGSPTPQPADAAEERGVQAIVKPLLYGFINTIVVTPVMIGFCAIIFRHEDFHRDPAVYAQLVKLCLFSSFVHQAAFTSISSLPFAIGQVQDAGLIFLSKIASEIADAMKDDPPEAMLATVLVTLSASTALLGLALIITGKLQLAALVQYLPLPVVGGYLAFIGLYCAEAGLSLMTGLQVCLPARCVP